MNNDTCSFSFCPAGLRWRGRFKFLSLLGYMAFISLNVCSHTLGTINYSQTFLFISPRPESGLSLVSAHPGFHAPLGYHFEVDLLVAVGFVGVGLEAGFMFVVLALG